MTGPAAAAVASLRARRWVQLALGALWIFDAVLQAQPSMFRAESFGMMLRMGSAVPPAWLWDLESRIEPFVTAHAWGCNLACVGIQLAVGLGIWWRRTTRVALVASVGWALVVWLFGEAVGGLFASGASALTGAPGAALLYALVALFAWPGEATDEMRTARRQRATCALWSLLWLGTALLELEALNRSGLIVGGGLSSTAYTAPGGVATIERGLGAFALAHAIWFAVLFAALQAFAALGVWSRRTRRAALVAALALAFVCGVVGQDVGGLLSGGWSGLLESGATDPGTGPPLVLLALALWPVASSSSAASAKEAQELGRGTPPLAA